MALALLLGAAMPSACTSRLDFDALSQGGMDGEGDSAAPDGALEPGRGDARGTSQQGDAATQAAAPAREIDAGAPLAETARDADLVQQACDGGTARFCDDFEEDDLSRRWSEVTLAPLGASNSLLVEPQGGEGRALLAILPEARQAQASLAYVRKTLEGLDRVPVGLRVELDLRVEQLDLRTDHSAVVFNLRFDTDGQAANQFILGVHPLGDGRFALRHHESIRPKPGDPLRLGVTAELGTYGTGRWLHVVYDLQMRAPAGASASAMKTGNRITVLIDGVSVLPSSELSLEMLGYRPQLDVGISWIESRQGHAAWRIGYDNVRAHVMSP